MAHIPPGFAQASFVILRAGDIDPYTSGFGLDTINENFDTAAADELALDLSNLAKPNLSPAETLVEVSYQYNDGGGVQQYGSAINVIGTLGTASSLLPQNCAALIQKRTGTPGRKGRGRMYWPSLQDTDVDSVGALAPGALTRLSLFAGGMITAIEGSDGFGNMVVLHAEADVGAPSQVSSVAVARTIATQRRRLRK
jgi:hypothetical protein